MGIRRDRKKKRARYQGAVERRAFVNSRGGSRLEEEKNTKRRKR